MRQLRAAFLITVAMTIGVASTSHAVVYFDYLGYAWEDGGVPTSNPGDALTITAVTDGVDPTLGIDLGAVEVTFYAYDLISSGEYIDGNGNTVIAYTGGTLEVYQDPSQDADWGIFPPNATSPTSFMNGTLLFGGSFLDFTIVLQPSGAGAYEGHLDGVAGLLLDSSCTDCGYTWGGAFTEDAGAQIPDGYDLQLDGTFEVDAPVASESSNWSEIKSLYR